ncbi:hypothetical protein SAMN04487949_3432 [Halogranum gelatinilyticum]|uniref:Uncharacterized protein n=1 Tax=Halogranum gelatinilyticum TaxID=660521 RepID=A0A1G9YS08_9EURY|nr:DUF5995 family protein [Halogranum gelatinilyticum]SDN11860.1 hypothetical protein SAMN04487949_3432 [Halogranum gelatinilyticum]
MRSHGPGSTRRKQLRVAVGGVRRGSSTDPRPRRDPELLGLVADPYLDVTDAHERLVGLAAAFEEREDRRAVFLNIYARMTAAVAEGIDRGDFADPEWVSAYLVEFANLYRQAVYDYEAGNAELVPEAWQLAFDAAARGDGLVVQDAALGVNAHINYDLALTLAAVGTESGRREKYADHHAVTDVISHLLDETQDALAERDAPGLETVDDSLGRLDEWLLVFTIDECRDSAWRTAVALQSQFGPRCRLARWLNDVTARGVARLILSSQANETVHERLRGLEASS